MYKERIREIYEHLSPGYRRVANFLLNHYQEVAFMTAAQVGQASQVDTALVVRFAQRLGYPGFPELLDDIQSDVKNDLQAVYMPTPEDNSPIAVLQRNLIEDRNNLEYMLLHLDMDTVQTVVEILEKAPTIFLAGEGVTSYLAEAFAARLVVFGLRAHVISSEPIGQAAVTATARPEDVFVGIGSTALNPGVAALLKIAREEGAHTVGIVAAMTNQVAAVAEYVLYTPVQTAGIMPSWTGIAAILHGLSQVLAVRRGAPGAWVMHMDRLLKEYREAMQAGMPRVKEVIANFNPAK